MIRLALTFPGQGSQVPGMAAGLLDEPLAATLLDVAAADGLDLRTALNGDEATLRATEIAQPALFLVEVVLNSLRPSGLEILGVAGHSIGEYAALVAAGAMDPATGMALVVKRGRAMAAMHEGTMAAVLGLDHSAVGAICEGVSVNREHVVVIANLNAPGQVVISGTAAGVTAASDRARAQGARKVIPLNVGGAFHSPLMAAAARDFAAEIDGVEIHDTRLPIVANVDGKASKRAEDIRRRLRRQLGSPVRWTDCVATLAGLGVDVLVEIGPGGVLSALARRIAPGVDTISVDSPEAMRALPQQLGVRV